MKTIKALLLALFIITSLESYCQMAVVDPGVNQHLLQQQIERTTEKIKEAKKWMQENSWWIKNAPHIEQAIRLVEKIYCGYDELVLWSDYMRTLPIKHSCWLNLNLEIKAVNISSQTIVLLSLLTNFTNENSGEKSERFQQTMKSMNDLSKEMNSLILVYKKTTSQHVQRKRQIDYETYYMLQKYSSF